MIKPQLLANIMSIYRERKGPFWISVGIGIFILILFKVMAHSQWGEDLENSAFDMLIRREAILAEDNDIAEARKDLERRQTPRVFFIDIDENTYQKWGEPLITPRDKLAAFLECAWAKKPKVVVLDILLEKKNCEDSGKGDKKLRDILTLMLADKSSRTHIVFPVTINSHGRIRKNLYDDLIEGKINIERQIFHFAAPMISASGSDLRNRYWDIYQGGVDENGKRVFIWGIPVIAAAIAEDKLNELTSNEPEPVNALSSHNGKEPMITLGKRVMAVPAFEVRSSVSRKEFVKEEAHSAIYSQRIRFRLIPKSSSMLLYARTADTFRLDLPKKERPNPLPDEVKDNIVVIGNSSPVTGDMHDTPYGPMAGMYIIGNAINTITSGLAPSHIPVWIHYLIEIIVIFFAAMIFMCFDAFLAQIICSICLLAVFVPISFGLFVYNGVFFNFVAPLVVMSFHRIGADLERIIKNRGMKGHN